MDNVLGHGNHAPGISSGPHLARIQEAMKWLSEVPIPSNSTSGPVGAAASAISSSRSSKRLLTFWTLECWTSVHALFSRVSTANIHLGQAYGLLSVTARCLLSVLAVNASCSPSPTWTSPTLVLTKTGGRS